MLWKAYIDFEISEGEGDNVRALYGKLLEKTNHVKVWISFGQFEITSVGNGIQAARKIFQDG
jgi:crooked neck